MEAWAWGLTTCGGVVLLATGGMLLVRRSVRLSALERHREVAGIIYTVLGGLYTVLLAFVVVVVWERHQTAETRVEEEANDLGDLFRDAEAFPDSVRDGLRARIRGYASIVVEDEWPSMARGRASPPAWRAFNGLWRGYLNFEPGTLYDQAWYTESLERLNELGDHRRLRLLSSRGTVPALMWAVLLAGGALTIAFSYMFGTPSVWSQILMTAALSGTVALILFLVFALEQPFTGKARVEPVPFQQLLEIFDRWEDSG